MSKTIGKTEAHPSDNEITPPSSSVRIRIWPAVLIALAQLIAAMLFARFGTTNIQNGIALGGVPLAATALLILWWLAASRVPWRERLLGLAIFACAVVAVLFSQRSVGIGALLLAVALPYMVYAVAIILLVTQPLRWYARRCALIGVLVVCAAVFCAMRVDSIGGDLAPVTSWRWQPTVAQRSGTLADFLVQQEALLPADVGPDDWPAFLGPRRDNRIAGVRFADDWHNTPPREIWRREIGPGWSSFIAVGDYLFTQEQRGEEELVACYRADTGAPVWRNRVEALFEDAMGLGPRATPVFSEGYLYTQGGTGILQRLDAATGETLWRRDLTEDANRGVPGYGFASSPLVLSEHVVVFTGADDGNNVIAYDRATGDIAWSAGRRASGHCSPQLETLGNMPQILMASNFGMQAFNVENGNLLWEHHWDIRTNPRCVQPVVMDNEYVMFGGTGTSGSRLLHVTRDNNDWQVDEQWSTRQFRPYFNNGALHEDHYYGYDGDRVACLALRTGERQWSGERYGGQLLLVVDMDMLLILAESGDVALVRATPEQFQEVARFPALNGKTWNHPTIHGGRLYLRNSQEAACYELPGLFASP